MVTTTETTGTDSSTGSGGQAGQFAVEIEHKIKQLTNEAKEEGVPIVGHTLEGLDNVGDGGGGALDPFAQLFASGFGWIIDSVSFLREPIDKVDGDAAAVQTAVDAMRTITENLTYVAHGHREDIPSLADWTGKAAEAHNESMQLLHEELLGLAKVVEGLGTLTAVSGAMVITLRKIVRELVTAGIAAICIILAAAVAAAIWTFGASIGVGIAASVAAAVAVMLEATRRITMLVDGLSRQADRMGELEGIAEEITKQLKRFEKAAGLPSGGPKKGPGGSGPGGPGAGGPGPEDGKGDPDEGGPGASEFQEKPPGASEFEKPPPPDPNEANPDYWNDLRDRANEKIEEIEKEIGTLIEEALNNKEIPLFGIDEDELDNAELERLKALLKEWETIRDDAEAKAGEASDRLDELELEQAQQDLGQ
jgi:hypothetical protein